MTFDYASPAELFMTKRKGGSRQPLVYRRFASAAEAIRFAIEDFPAVQMPGVWLQVDDERFDSDDKSLDALIAPTWASRSRAGKLSGRFEFGPIGGGLPISR
jgi:hypothetical protein